MILSEFKELMLSKTISRKVIPDDIRLQERVFTALKKIAMDTIPLRLVVQDPTGHSIMRRVDEITYIRFPDMPLYDDSEIDIDMFLLDAAALYVMAGLEKEKASIYMGMYWEILTENDNRLCETYLSTATNENGFDDADFKFSGRGGNSLVVNYGQSSGQTGSGNFVTNAELLARVEEITKAGYVIDSSYVHTDNNFTNILKTKLDGIAEGAEVNVQSDWNAITGDSVILNKPTTLAGYGITDAGDMQKSVYDTTGNGIVDNAETVNGFTVGKSVPANAVFTDTIYNDTILSQRVTSLENAGFVVDANYVHTDNNFTTTLKNKLDGLSNYVKPSSEPISYIENLQQSLDNKVNKVTGKGLSTEDYSTAEKTKLAGIASGAEVNVNPDWNALTGDAVILNKPTTLNGYGITNAQEKLVSGQNIKTINGTDILGAGNLEVTVGSGGYAANVYFTTFASTTNVLYKQISYTPEPTQTIMSATVNNNEVLIEDYIFDGDVLTTAIPAGEWAFHFYRRANSIANTSYIRFEVFKRTSSGVETILFSQLSQSIESTSFTQESILVTQPIFTVNQTDRIGIKLYASTTRTSNTIIDIAVGDGIAAYFTTPLEIRHNQLRARDAIDAHPISAITNLQSTLDLKASVSYVDTLVGDINSALDTINGQVI